MPAVKIGAHSYNIPDDSDLQEIISILSGEGKMPTTAVANLPSGTFGEYFPARHHINIDQLYGGTVPTVTHEFSHALDNVMGRQKNQLEKQGRDISPEELRFIDGYMKLDPTKTKLTSNYPPNTYRTHGGERRAFGVGNMQIRGPITSDYNPERAHMDASMAQEAAILRDLFQRRKK